ncbi:MAG: cupin domain-containing protein [Bacilli bacterium]|jgi:quercetin dioxygenase-like cupin family protein|nr:cupin domain-containing protein [Bacilli bacterium]
MSDETYVENMAPKTVTELAKLIPLEPGSIVSKILFQNDAVSLTLFSFGKGQAIATHVADGDALVQVLEGEGTFTVDGIPHIVKKGEVLLMPHHHPHALQASADFKMLLTVLYPTPEKAA